MDTNFEARKFGSAHQAPSLAGWAGSPWHANDGDQHPVIATPAGNARIGDWIIKGADGTVRVERAGNQDGYCTDCGEPVWWHDDRLVTRSGLKWCQGAGGAHPGMTRWHALPGMAQYVVRSPDGAVCHCPDWGGPHIHRLVTVPPERAHRIAAARAVAGEDVLADLRAEDGHVPDTARAETERRLWELLEAEDRHVQRRPREKP